MLVKVCGLTNFHDAQSAMNMGAGALGFVFFRGSPRFVEPQKLRHWIGDLPSGVKKVGVFVNESRQRMEELCESLGLNVAQLHGAEKPTHHPHSIEGLEVWKAFRVSGRGSVDYDYPADAILLDGPGGGHAFDWRLCALVKSPLILAGGLNEFNIAEAISIAQPWAVDIASGIESEPGRKDHTRMKRFIEAASQCAMQTTK